MSAPWPSLRRRAWVRWVELGLGALFVVAGLVKASGVPFLVELFTSLGFGQWLRFLTAVIEMTGGALLLTGRFQYLASLALAVVMVGATDASIVVFDRSPVPPLLTLMALLVVAWMRHPSGANATGR